MSVLIGYVETPEGRAALRHGLREASLRGVPVHIVHSVKVEAPGDAAGVAHQGAHLREEEERLEAIKQRAVEAGLEAHTHFILETRGEGQFVRDFKRLADKVGATLAVIGVRHRSRVGKLVMGSRAQDVLLHVDCDVLAVKADHEDEAGAHPHG
jgi:nucleotide-binding universal stress UspA family protein